MTTEAVIDVDSIFLRIRLASGVIRAVDGQLKLSIPGGIPPDLLEAVRSNKTDLLARLEKADYAKEHKRHEVRSRIGKAVPVLWEMELRGQMGTPRYTKWFSAFENLLASYEHLMSEATA